MKPLSKALLIGRMASEPSMSGGLKDDKIAEFAISTPVEDRVIFLPVVARKTLADVIETFYKKGDNIYVEADIDVIGTKTVFNLTEINKLK